MLAQDKNIKDSGEYITITRAEYEKLNSDILYLTQELAKLKRMIFGSKSERFISEGTDKQLTLDLGLEKLSDPEVKTEEVTYTRKKQQTNEKPSHAREVLPSHLRREEIIIEPKEDIVGAKKIGENITEILEYKPGELYVKKYIRPKYALPEEKGIVTGELPSLPIPKGNFGPSLLAQIIISKFVDHLPFYRQVQMYKRLGMTLAESTINDGFRFSINLLESLYDRLKIKILELGYLMADETPIPVLTTDKPGSTHKGYHWVYYSPPEKFVLFEYRKSRGQEGPKEFLKEFSGTLQTDGYAGYNIFEQRKDITLLACMAHARRKFENALTNDKQRSEHVLQEIQKLYTTERHAHLLNLNPEERKELRQKESVPVLQNLEKWMKEQITEVLPKSSFGQALGYTLNLWYRLIRYVDDGRYEIDNNLIENSIRPVALGRKNYLFAGSHEAAQRAAMIYSFLGTCKMNNINPYQWLTDVLTRISDCKQSQLDMLLPSNWKKEND
jgi:transposase